MLSGRFEKKEAGQSNLKIRNSLIACAQPPIFDPLGIRLLEFLPPIFL